MKYGILLFIAASIFTSCEKYNEDVLPVVGVYHAHILSGSGDFSMGIQIDYGRNIRIDAPWDDFFWYEVDAKVRHEEDWDKDIKIPLQWIDDGIEIKGEGVFFENSIQLDYTLWIDGYPYEYTLVGSKE